MPPVIWQPKALHDLETIIDYIEARNPSAAERTGAAIRHTADRLPDHPYMHRPGRVPGSREAVVSPNYIIVYEVGIDAIDIIAVQHTRQQYP